MDIKYAFSVDRQWQTASLRRLRCSGRLEICGTRRNGEIRRGKFIGSHDEADWAIEDANDATAFRVGATSGDLQPRVATQDSGASRPWAGMTQSLWDWVPIWVGNWTGGSTSSRTFTLDARATLEIQPQGGTAHPMLAHEINLIASLGCIFHTHPRPRWTDVGKSALRL